MAGKERENFFKGAVSRAPGKRKIKPSVALLADMLDEPATDSDDMEFTEDKLSSDDSSDSAGEYVSSESGDEPVDESCHTINKNQLMNNGQSGDVRQIKQLVDNDVGGGTDEQHIPLSNNKIDSSADHGHVCSICLNLRKPESDLLGELIQCDKLVYEKYVVYENIGLAWKITQNKWTSPFLFPSTPLSPSRNSHPLGNCIKIFHHDDGITERKINYKKKASEQKIQYNRFEKNTCLEYEKGAPSFSYFIDPLQLCGLLVHELCYGVKNTSTAISDIGHHAVDAQSTSSSVSTEPWFCELCLLGNGILPHCELCPNRYGAFKRADIKGSWVHMVCALYTPEILFLDMEHLSLISWQQIDYRNFGRKPCVACTDKLEARTGITVRCDVGLCKNYYHITCAQSLGLLVTNTPNNQFHSYTPIEVGYLHCKRHSHDESAVTNQKNAYTKFLCQEDHRMVAFKNVKLDPRQEKKWHTLREELLSRQNKELEQKQTIDEEKAELLGLSRQQFEDEFYNVPAVDLPLNLPPAFSKSYISYVEYRDKFYINEEKNSLALLDDFKNRLLQNQKNIENELTEAKETNCSLNNKYSIQERIFLRFKAVLKTYAPTALEQIETNKKVNRKRSNAKFRDSDECLPSMKNKQIEDKICIGCKKCKKATDPHLQIYCATCRQHCHIGCLDPPLTRMPTKNKFFRFECSDCACPSDNEDNDSDTGNQTEREKNASAEDLPSSCTGRMRRRIRKKL